RDQLRLSSRAEEVQQCETAFLMECTARRQTISSTIRIKISARLSPTHSPSSPKPRRKQSQAPSGKPIIQYAVKWQNIGVRVSPAPRKAPVAAGLMPAKNLNAAPVAQRSTLARHQL